MPHKKHPTAAAFTLVELLVVVALVAALMLLGLAALEAARRSSLDARCSNNLRQLGVSIFAYSQDHQGCTPPRLLAQGTIPEAHRYWHRALRYLGYLNTPLVNARKASIHYCPAFTYNTSDLDYGTNDQAYGLRRWHAPGREWDFSQKLSILEKPSEFFLLVDSYHMLNEEQAYFVRGGDTTWRVRLTHGGRANTLFADGHLAPMPRSYFESVHLTQAEYTESKAYRVWPE